MLENLARIFAIGAFVVVVGFLGLILWQSLFGSEIQNKPANAEAAQTEQQSPPEKLLGGGAVDVAIAKYTRWLAVFTALLVLVSVFQFGFLIQANQTATKTANAAKESANVAKQALVNAQRAFVFLEGITTKRNIDSAGNTITWIFFPVWKNSGSTPTKIFRFFLNMKPFDGDLPEDFDFADGVGELIETFIPPQGVGGTTGLVVPIADIEAIIARTKRLFLWGWAEYDDIFENTLRHRVEYCVEVVIFGEARTDKNLIEHRVYRRHNRHYDIQRKK